MKIKSVQFIWVRHGLSESNVISNQFYYRYPNKLIMLLMKKLHRFQKGFTWNKDSRLTSIGRKQARQFAKSMNPSIDILASSNLVRAFNTAKEMRSHLQFTKAKGNYKNDVIVLPYISEINTYIGHGAKSYKSLNNKSTINLDYVTEDTLSKPSNMKKFMFHCKQLIHDFFSNNPSRKTLKLMIVSHGRFMRNFLPGLPKDVIIGNLGSWSFIRNYNMDIQRWGKPSQSVLVRDLFPKWSRNYAKYQLPTDIQIATKKLTKENKKTTKATKKHKKDKS